MAGGNERSDCRKTAAVEALLLGSSGQTLRAEQASVDRDLLLLRGQNRGLRLLATGAGLVAVLEALIAGAESATPGMIGSILLLEDGALRHGAAPRLPIWYREAIDGTVVGPRAGSCGTAAFLRRRVVVEHIETDPLWESWRRLAERAKLKACWSEPIFGSDGACLGTFAMYYPEPRTPAEADLRAIESVAHVAGIAIERHRSERQLRETSRRAEAASVAKTAFLAHMSHELRTPLNAIIGFADLLEQEMFGSLGSDRNRQYARDIADSGRHLLNLIAGLLQLSTLATGEAPSDGEDRIAPEALVAEAITQFEDRLRQKRIRLASQVAPDMPDIQTDAPALRQVLLNILDNAVKFTPDEGSIEVTLKRIAEEPTGSAKIVLTVRDTGGGIEPDQLPHIREAFYASGSPPQSVAQGQGGLGLGLTIADRLIQAIGGEMRIESHKGTGTLVTIVL